MCSLLILAVFSVFPEPPTLYKVTEKNGLTYEVTSYETDGLCYLFHRPNGETSRWFRDRIQSIEKIDLSGTVPAPPAPPEIPREKSGKRVLVPDEDRALAPGKKYTLYRFGEPEISPVEAAEDLWYWQAANDTSRMSEDAIEWHKIKCRIINLHSGTPVLLVRLGDLSKKPEMDNCYAAVKILDGPYRGKTLFTDRKWVRTCRLEMVK